MKRPAPALLALALALLAGCAAFGEAEAPRSALAAEPLARWDPFLDTLQERSFRFFWETTNAENGLVPDRWPTPSFSSVAAVGFGLTAYVVGAERGYVAREAAAARTLTTLRFLWHAPQSEAPDATGHHGFFYHFLDMETGRRYGTIELSTIDTALLIAGALSAGVYFDGPGEAERGVRAYADSLYRRVEWTWAQPRPPLVSLGWHPESGFLPYDYGGYNETMLLYLLALGSPTHPIAEAAWPAYTAGYRWGSFYGHEHVAFGPLFGHQYTHAWVDFRGIRDGYMRARGLDYFENSRRATLAQRAYAAANPGGWRGYGPDVWGLTACDGPVDTTLVLDGRERAFRTYWARGAALGEIHDDGTIAPTAAGGSLPFAPEEATRALKTLRARYGEGLWGEYGFFDSFNPTFDVPGARVQHGRVVPGLGWFDTDYLGIDQGPIVLMIENARSGLVWSLMRRHPAVRRGLARAGFTGGWLDAEAQP